MPEKNGWSEYRKLVVVELARCADRLTEVEKRLNSIDKHISSIQTKIYMASAMAALVFSGIMTLALRFFSL